MDHIEEIPYYHTNIDENNQKSFETLVNIIDKYGVTESSTITDNNQESVVALINKVSWSNHDIMTDYMATQFYSDDAKIYGNHVMLKVVEHVGNEQEIYILFFHNSENIDTPNKIVCSKQTFQRTRANQEKYDQWWEANKKGSEGAWFAVTDTTTDEIAYEAEFTLHTVEQAEQLIKEQHS